VKRLLRENITIILAAVILWLLLKPPGCLNKVPDNFKARPDTTKEVTPVKRQGSGYAVKKSIQQSDVKKNTTKVGQRAAAAAAGDSVSILFVYSDSNIDLTASFVAESLAVDYSIYCDSVTVTIRDTTFIPYTPASIRAGFIYTPGMAGPALFYDSGTIHGGIGIDAASRALLFAMSVNVLTFERRKFRNDDRRRIKGKGRRNW